jgi:thiamine transport system substrate-binding protein
MKKSTWLFLCFMVLNLVLAACGPLGASTPVTHPSSAFTPTSAPAGGYPAQGVTPENTAYPAPGQTPAETPTATLAPGTAVLNVMTHDSFAASQPVIAAFEQANHVHINFIKSGDAGAALNKAILTKSSPVADVFYGVDNTFLSRSLSAGIYAPYNSPLLANIPAEFKLDPQNNVLPVDYGDVCINYDKAYFTKHSLAVPQTLDDLTKPDYKGLLVMENPATSSPGLAFLLATIAHFGPDKYIDYWKSLRQNGLVVVDGWETAYYTNFSGSSGKGAQPLVLSYATSQAAEVVDANPPVSESPIGTIVGPQTCFRQIEFVGILAGTQQRALAEKFVDFMLSPSFQEDMPLQMYVYPVNSQAKVPDVFTKNVTAPAQPASMSPDEISKNRDAWIQAWTQAVLQ